MSKYLPIGLIAGLMFTFLQGCGGTGGSGSGSESSPSASIVISDNPIFNFGNVTINESLDHTFLITNSGQLSATNLSLNSLAAPFVLKGGSYPGTGGTCSTELAAGASCTIIISYNPIQLATNSTSLEISFLDAAANRTSSITITGNGVSPIWTGTIQKGVSAKGVGPKGIGIDSKNNIYVTGSSSGGMDGYFVNNGETDFFLIKYNASGIRQWTKMNGGAAGSWATGIDIDTEDNIYLIFASTSKSILKKYSSSGELIWSLDVDTTASVTINDVTHDNDNNVYIAGSTSIGLDGNGQTGTRDFFVSKLDKNGNKIWTRQLGGTGERTFGNAIGVDITGNVYVAGHTWVALDGNIKTGSYNIFLSKYNPSGLKQWTKQLSTSNSMATGLSFDSAQNVYVVGSYNSTYDFLILNKFDSSGKTLLTVMPDDIPQSNYPSIKIDSSDNVFISGYFTNIYETNRVDYLIAKYSPSGMRSWLKQDGAANKQVRATGIALDSSGSAFICGTTTIGLDGNSQTGLTDLFITKFSSAGEKQ